MPSMNSGLVGLLEEKPSDAWIVVARAFFLLDDRLWGEVGSDFRGVVVVDDSLCCSLLFNCSLNG